eukprot:gnl/MRDRNA2_/MRDRNA2_28758_c0_seq1.p1 gnl/MRDRNA2_/MRDRNA2_28758_c0~~gnl/MRDRNA2_/MRDRNA2_28758_c0_seq1.p1  ORF type:complete len:761 (-),score=172.93 gnl/MRDRNA2_/MRDRNA2_28758_c0_seq1:14-2296(-)
MAQDGICWDLKTKGFCPRLQMGGFCGWAHPNVPGNMASMNSSAASNASGGLSASAIALMRAQLRAKPGPSGVQSTTMQGAASAGNFSSPASVNKTDGHSVLGHLQAGGGLSQSDNWVAQMRAKLREKPGPAGTQKSLEPQVQDASAVAAAPAWGQKPSGVSSMQQASGASGGLSEGQIAQLLAKLREKPGAKPSTPSTIESANSSGELQDIEGLTFDAPDFVEPPEHLVDAIAGSMRMKRFLEIDMEEGQKEFDRMDLIEDGKKKAEDTEELEEPAPKKRRLITVDEGSMAKWQEDEEETYMPYTEEEEAKIEKVTKVLTKWKIPKSYPCRWVLESLVQNEEIDKLSSDASWAPIPTMASHAMAEQIVMKVDDYRSISGPPKTEVDMIKTFALKWGLSIDDTQLLKTLDLKDLKYVIENHNGELSIQDLIDASKQEEDMYEKRLPGVLCHVRTMRLELIDGASDALVLGDANLTFSALLAQHRANLGHPGKVIATTFEDFKTLSLRYKELARTIKVLLGNEAQVWHGVDCTRLAVDPRFHGFEEAFGAVYYNFPHAGAVRGFFDAHPFVNWRHSNLMALFFRALSYFVKPDAIVKVSSNARARGVQAPQIILAAEYSGFMHIETFPFPEWVLRRYHRSYGDKRDEKGRPQDISYKSQQAQADMVYCFRYVPTGDSHSMGVPIKQPPTVCDFMNDVRCCACGYIGHAEMVYKRKDGTGELNARHHFKDSGSHKEMKGNEKRKMVLDLYQRFLTEASGVHIG